MASNSHATERSNLTKRILSEMTLSKGRDAASEARIDTLHPAARDSAAGRFSIAGNAVVTGGTGGIGMVVSRAMLQHGLSGLMMFDLNVEASREALQALRDEFPEAKIEAREVDVTNEEDVATSVTETVKLLGSLDMLICLAGIVGCAHALDMPVSQWRRVLDINTTGAFICAQAAAREMVRQGNGGRIIFTASISAHRVNFPQPQAAYNVSKGALLMLKNSLAAEWARTGSGTQDLEREESVWEDGLAGGAGWGGGDDAE
ncbi:short chain dehydrogenase [Trichoderma arundinaceum]|uniref:Short chain dehydrogenase n=1 Tax=Trichoderma arundinaceum TaxID=490622 RepID=A0A395NLJ0_TRIAR|nr:short chain dehydrogenase [Trichoderma arundinaceum]